MGKEGFKINFITVIKLIIKAIRLYRKTCAKKLKSMCFKRWFKKPELQFTPNGKKTLLSFAINKYGGGNDLRGCLNDQKNFCKMVKDAYPDFVIKQFKDADVTKRRFIEEVKRAIAELKEGYVLLLHFSGHGTQVIDRNGDETNGYDEGIVCIDGVVIDDDIADALRGIRDDASVDLFFDSCFSRGNTRNNPTEFRNKFIPNPEVHDNTPKRIRIPREDMKYAVFSACQEHQTAADAFLNNEYCGAFTCYLTKSFKTNITRGEWDKGVHEYLPSSVFDQDPALDTNERLFSKIVLT